MKTVFSCRFIMQLLPRSKNMKKNVLVFPCGSEIGLEINRALRDSAHFTLFGANSVDDHGKYVYKNYVSGLPFADAPNFIDEINKIIELYNIDFVIPAHDSVVLKMAESQNIIKAIVITSRAETCRICRSKRKTYELLGDRVPVPRIYDISEEMDFPIFLKPDVGQGTKGTYKVNTKEDIRFHLINDPTLLILEYLPGREYTVDCFTDRNGVLLFSEGRERIRINNGISVKSRRAHNVRFQEIAEIINKALSFQGVWFYQVKERKNDELVLLEVSPRIAGTMALFREEGINFAALSLFDKMDFDVTILDNNLDIEIDRALFSRFAMNYDYDYVYIDFDDTIIVDNLVNENVMRFLYQARNMCKKIILLSKHKHDIGESLRRFAISAFLFDKVIILKQDESKSDYITYVNSIFIDDSFIERKKVFEKLHIPVFALDAIESLLLWKA